MGREGTFPMGAHRRAEYVKKLLFFFTWQACHSNETVNSFTYRAVLQASKPVPAGRKRTNRRTALGTWAPALFVLTAALLGAGAHAAAPGGAERSAAPRATLHVGLQVVRVEVADTPARQQQGLSYRRGLAAGTGMYFPYPTPGRPAFWMKDMHFDIDIVWIYQGRIVEISHDVPHEPGTESRVQPQQEIDAVLEVPAGTARRWHWQRGTEVRLVAD